MISSLTTYILILVISKVEEFLEFSSLQGQTFDTSYDSLAKIQLVNISRNMTFSPFLAGNCPCHNSWGRRTHAPSQNVDPPENCSSRESLFIILGGPD